MKGLGEETAAFGPTDSNDITAAALSRDQSSPTRRAARRGDFESEGGEIYMRKLQRQIMSRSRRLIVLALLLSHQTGWTQTNVLQNRNDPAASGTNLNEVTLTPSR